MVGRVEIVEIEAPTYAKEGEWVYIKATATNWGDDDYCSIYITTEPNIGWLKEGKMLRKSNTSWVLGLSTRFGKSDVTVKVQGGHWVGDTLVFDDEKTFVIKFSTAKLEVTKVEVL